MKAEQNVAVDFARLLTGVVCALLLVSGHLAAQTPPVTYPKNVDIGISGITLNFRQSTQQVLGDRVQLTDRGDRKSELVCRNREGSAEVRFVHHEGRGALTFQEFDVQVVKGEPAPTAAPQEALPEENAADDTCVLAVDEIESARGVRLGMSLSKVTEIFGDRFRVETSGDTTVIVYSIESNLSSRFLKYYDALSYYGRYYFRGGKLERFHFGLDNL